MVHDSSAQKKWRCPIRIGKKKNKAERDMKKSLKFAQTILSVMVVIAVIVIGWFILQYVNRESDGEQPEDPGELKPVAVEVARVAKTALRPTLNQVGQLVPVPEHTAVLSAQAGGWVQQVMVVEGQDVHAGDVLVVLDPRSAQSDLLTAKARVAEKEAALLRLKQGPLPEEIDAAKETRDSLQATVDSLANELDALKGLLQRGEMSPIQFQTREKQLQSEKASLAAADAKLRLLQRGTRPELIAESEAQLQAARADLEHASLAVEWCTVKSPIDGVVVQLNARQGQYFDQATPLVTVMDLTRVFAQVRIPSDALGGVGIDAPADVRVTGYPADVFHGKIVRANAQADKLSGDVTMFVAIDNPDRRLRPGLGCRVHILLRAVSDALVVPIDAVADRSGTPVVTVVRDAKAYEVPVEPGVQTDTLVQIVKGLNEGDVVATRGGYGLPDGCPVVVHGPAAPGRD